jgi:hypothetical protein
MATTFRELHMRYIPRMRLQGFCELWYADRSQTETSNSQIGADHLLLILGYEWISKLWSVPHLSIQGPWIESTRKLLLLVLLAMILSRDIVMQKLFCIHIFVKTDSHCIYIAFFANWHYVHLFGRCLLVNAPKKIVKSAKNAKIMQRKMRKRCETVQMQMQWKKWIKICLASHSTTVSNESRIFALYSCLAFLSHYHPWHSV